MSSIWQSLLRIPAREASFARRKFHFFREPARQRLEQAGETFLHGYHIAMADEGNESIAERLNEIDLEFRGFAFEGAAMALDILDQLTPWRSQRIHKFLSGPGSAHIYMVHVGMGWSMARCRFGLQRRLARLNPLLKWLALDGLGFHEGYFHWPRYATGEVPRILRHPGYGSRAFHQGLGRSLWFVGGADPEYISAAILRFPEPHRDDVWSGIGLASTYAGGAQSCDLHALRLASGPYWPHLAQGAVFAAGARQRAGNVSAHTEAGCQALCSISARRAAELCEETLRDLTAYAGPGNAAPAYEQWRRLIRLHLQVSQDIYENFPLMTAAGRP